jgi:hypothetical protein
MFNLGSLVSKAFEFAKIPGLPTSGPFQAFGDAKKLLDPGAPSGDTLAQSAAQPFNPLLLAAGPAFRSDALPHGLETSADQEKNQAPAGGLDNTGISASWLMT